MISIKDISPLSSDDTLLVLSHWNEIGSFPELESAQLNNADFSSDDTCTLLAEFINTAYNMNELKIEC